MRIAICLQLSCIILALSCVPVRQLVDCRRVSTVVEEGILPVLQQTEATTTLSLTHSVTYQQPVTSLSDRQHRRLERQRNLQRSWNGKEIATSAFDWEKFDWEVYLSLNPDLVEQGCNTQLAAIQHYRYDRERSPLQWSFSTLSHLRATAFT